MTEPRDPRSLDHIRIFDEGCVRSRLQELTLLFISQHATEKMRKVTDQAKRKFQPLPVCDWSHSVLEEEYGEKALKEAQEVLETERRSYVDLMTPNIQRDLTRLIKQLRYLVYAVDEGGKPYKLQHIVETAVTPDHQGNWDLRETAYVGEHDTERFHSIRLLNHRLAEFRHFVPYFNDELKGLWSTANDLATLEIVHKK